MKISNWLPSWLKELFSDGAPAKKNSPFRSQQTRQNQPSLQPSIKTEGIAVRSETLEDALAAYLKAPNSGALEQAAIDKISKIARSFEEWSWVYGNVAHDSRLGRVASDRMTALASTLDDFETLVNYQMLTAADANTSSVFRKIVQATQSLDDCLTAFSFATKHEMCDIAKLTEARLSELAHSTEEWIEVLQNAEGNAPLELLATKKAIETSTTLEERVTIYNATLIDEADTLALVSIEASEGSIDDWKSAIDRLPTGKSDDLARKKLAAAISSLDELSDSDEYFSDDEASLAREVIDRLKPDEDALESLIENASAGVILDAAYQKLFDMAEDVPQMVDFYQRYNENISSEMEEKLLEKVRSTATLNELWLIRILMEEEGGSLWNTVDQEIDKRAVPAPAATSA